MIISATEFQNNVGRYLALAEQEEIIITKNGVNVARLVGEKKGISYLADRLAGILPASIDLGVEMDERLNRQ